MPGCIFRFSNPFFPFPISFSLFPPLFPFPFSLFPSLFPFPFSFSLPFSLPLFPFSLPSFSFSFPSPSPPF